MMSFLNSKPFQLGVAILGSPCVAFFLHLEGCLGGWEMDMSMLGLTAMMAIVTTLIASFILMGLGKYDLRDSVGHLVSTTAAVMYMFFVYFAIQAAGSYWAWANVCQYIN